MPPDVSIHIFETALPLCYAPSVLLNRDGIPVRKTFEVCVLRGIELLQTISRSQPLRFVINHNLQGVGLAFADINTSFHFLLSPRRHHEEAEPSNSHLPRTSFFRDFQKENTFFCSIEQQTFANPSKTNRSICRTGSKCSKAEL
jgi:hypothetical protein